MSTNTSVGDNRNQNLRTATYAPPGRRAGGYTGVPRNRQFADFIGWSGSRPLDEVRR